MLIREATIAVTYRCNLKCAMCNIWRSTPQAEIAASEYTKLPVTLRTINITGGEPFLRQDLLDVVKSIHSVVPDARVVVSSNGYLTNTILKQMRLIRAVYPNVGIGISLDGVEETHDRIRGVPGSYSHAMQTTGLLRDDGFDDVRFGMTVTPDNMNEVESVYLLAEDLGIQFTATYAHNSDIYFGKSDNPSPECSIVNQDSVQRVINHLLSSWTVKDWLRAYHFGGMLDPSIRRSYLGLCEAGMRYVFIAPDGSVYPCNVLDMKLGNLSDVSKWDEMFTKEAQDKMVEEVRSCRRDCWMVCNTRSLILAHPLRAAKWIARRRLGLALRRG